MMPFIGANYYPLLAVCPAVGKSTQKYLTCDRVTALSQNLKLCERIVQAVI